MFESMEKSPLYPFLNPKSIAFYGASNSFSAMGTTQFRNIYELGFQGNLYPIHPKLDQVQGWKAYNSVLDLPEAPDLAVMVLPTRIVPEVMEECGRKGIKNVIIVSGGFKEVGGEGAGLQEQIVAIANQYRMRFLGPNCIGVVNPYHKLNTTFFPYDTAPGFIGMASQSGSFVTQMFDYLAKFGLGFSSAISVGNEANIDMVDCLEYLAACPHTKVIALYIEAIRRGREFLDMARSITPHKPIVALYVGGSEAGKRAGFSHTGAMAGPDRLYDGVFRQSGVIRARSIEELFDFCWVLGACPIPKGNRVAIQTHSGGPGAAAADACGRVGLDLPSLSSATRKKLAPFVPHTASIKNPVDLTFTKNPLDYFHTIPKVLLEGEETDGLLVYFLVPTQTVRRALESMGMAEDQGLEQSEKIIEQQSDAVSALPGECGKPVLGYSLRTRDDFFIARLQDKGIPVLGSPERGARAMGALVRYARWRKESC
ncbi:MAG: CoA-binding protein [Deltaproteobacteria bacterium]|nr:CoA-binding protein [Deltaproteobacteria bacterium]